MDRPTEHHGHLTVVTDWGELRYKCDFLVHHSGRPGGATHCAAGYQICRPGFESRQGTSMWLPLVYCDVKYKCDFPAGRLGGMMERAAV